MKIGIHSNQYDQRGTGKVPLDYGIMLQKYGNHDIVYITSNDTENLGLESISKKFKTITYNGNANNIDDRNNIKNDLNRIINQERIDFLYMVKWGTNDNITPNNCKTGIHCVFEMTEPHGDIYVGVSEYISKKYNQTNFVPHIIKQYTQTEDIRKKYNISNEMTVIGRHGGISSFNIPFVQRAINDILIHRKDIIFMFLSTEKFINHDRVLFLPWVKTEEEKYNIIHATDAMLHARLDGETFGLSIGESSSCNKPIITWSGDNYKQYDKCHLDILGKKAILYNNYEDILNILYSIKREETIVRQWDVYSKVFSEENVYKKFNSVFLA